MKISLTARIEKDIWGTNYDLAVGQLYGKENSFICVILFVLETRRVGCDIILLASLTACLMSSIFFSKANLKASV